MKTMKWQAPHFKLAPNQHQLLNQIRMKTDILGLGLVFMLGPFIPGSFQWLVEIYTVLAWATIFTIDPSRLPEASTTRLKQHQAFKIGVLLLPLYIIVFIGLFLTSPLKLDDHVLSIALITHCGVSTVLVETYFRNIVQVLFRKWGISVWSAVFLQSLMFGFMFYIKHQSFPLLIGTFLIGFFNGWISYKTRSLLFNMIITFLLIWFLK